jgi:L-asparagine transporter-like permease
MAHVGLINALQTLWHLSILVEKGASVTMTDLSPSFGLQSHLAAGAPKYLYALASYFSVFTVWHIVMLTIGFAALGRISPIRAFLVTAPSWVLSLLFFIVVTMARQ